MGAFWAKKDALESAKTWIPYSRGHQNHTFTFSLSDALPDPESARFELLLGSILALKASLNASKSDVKKST